MAEAKPHVLIIGAGCTGLLIAQGLKTPQREWGMSLHWGGEYLSSLLPTALRSRVDEIDCDPFYDASKDEGFVQCNGATGDIILVMQGKMPRRVSRAKTRALLNEGIEVQHSKELIEIATTADSVTATFADGATATGTLLVGADGSRSRTRSLLFPGPQSENSPADISILNFPAQYPADVARGLRAVHPVFKVSYHPARNVMYLLCILDNHDPDRPETWTYQNLLSWKGAPYPSDLTDPADRVKRLKDLGKDFAEPWRSAALHVADDAVLSVDSGTLWDPRSVDWEGKASRGMGRVTLAGDAAHTMLPHRGQGLNHGLQDAKELVDALARKGGGKGGWEEAAVKKYEKEMVGRAGVEVEITGRQAAMAHDWEKLMQSPMFKIGANKSK